MKLNFKKFLSENWMLILAILYVLSPIDLIPDFIPALGFTDDIGALLLAFIVRFLKHLHSERVSEKKKKDNVIEGEIVE